MRGLAVLVRGLGRRGRRLCLPSRAEPEPGVELRDHLLPEQLRERGPAGREPPGLERLRGCDHGRSAFLPLFIPGVAGRVLDELDGELLLDAAAQEEAGEGVGDVVPSTRLLRPVPGDERAGGDVGDRGTQRLTLHRSRLAVLVEADRLARGMRARRPYGLRAGAPQLDEHGAVRVLELRGFRGRLGSILPVRPGLAVAAEHATRVRQERIRDGECLRCIKIDVHEPTARLAVEHADVRAVREVAREVRGGQA